MYGPEDKTKKGGNTVIDSDSDEQVDRSFSKKWRANEDKINETLMPDAGKVILDPAMPWGRGICSEIKNSVIAWWWPEMKNFNQKTVAVSMLMFLTIIAPTLTFGAVYGNVTNNTIGAVESILSTSWVGCTYALVSGMPMAIIGSTGPLLIMTTAIESMSASMNVPFATFYAWISVWIGIYSFICAFFDITRFVKMATRFTDDAFALLIVSIFLMDAIGDPFSNTGILKYFQPNHPFHNNMRKEDPEYDYMTTALLSTVLGFGTTWLIFLFRGFKFTSFFCNQNVRTSLFDFSVTLSVIIFTCLYQFLFSSIPMEGLKVPSQFEPTFQCCDEACTLYWPTDCEGQEAPVGVRPWFADMGDLNGKAYIPIVAAGPALLAFLLVYLDNGITWHLINHPSNKLVHGVAYNWDLLLDGAMNAINGMLGLPWLVATTVPCMIHVSALAEKDKEGHIIYTQETRLTGLFAHLLLGLTLLFLNVLKLIPMPVLYGVFLFMGLASIGGIQFWQRFLLFLQQPSIYPDYPYVKYMQKGRVHLYTVIQIFFFGLIFFVQNFDPIKIAFPLMTFLCIPARIFLFPRIFKGWELLLLDGDDDDIEEWIKLKEESKTTHLLEEGVILEDDGEYELGQPVKVVDVDDHF